jgi:hypothetical protein
MFPRIGSLDGKKTMYLISVFEQQLMDLMSTPYNPTIDHQQFIDAICFCVESLYELGWVPVSDESIEAVSYYDILKK